MAETRVADVIIPEVFTDYTLVPSIYRSRFFRSGIITTPAELTGLLNQGGRTFNMPAWDDTAGDTGAIPSETAETAVTNITASKEVALRQFREKIWGANDLSAVLAGDDALESAQNRVMDYWAQAMDQIAVKTIQGLIADNVANDSGDLVVDLSGSTGTAAANFSDDAVIDTQAKLGENGTVGREDQVGGDFVAIMVHPNVYAYMRKLDLIDYVPVSGQPRPLPFYMNMQVIVDRNAPLNTLLYDTYIMKTGAIGYGVGTSGYLPTETDRNTKQGFGIDELITRRAFTMHPYGMAWLGASVAGQSPTDAELILAANWDRIKPQETMRVVCLKHEINN